jgi:signal transduction histidine kinase
MFRWKDKFNSLAFRFSLISISCLLILIIIFGGLISWSFKKNIDQTLINYLSSQVDLLVAGTNIDNNGNIHIDDKLKILNKTPCVWQISYNNYQVNKNLKIKNIKIIKSTTGDGDLVSFEYNDVKMRAVIKNLEFPSNKIVSYIYGLPEQNISSLSEDEIKDFYYSLIILISILTIVLTIIVFTQVKYSLLPLHKIKSALEDVFLGKTSRIQGVFFSEVKPLINELNQLLDYSDNLIERHRTFASNLAHSIKTPLSVIKNISNNGQINEQVKIIELIINRNLARLRVAGSSNLLGSRTEIVPIIKIIGKNYSKLYQKEITINADEQCYFKGDESDLYEVIGNIVENACKFASSKISISVTCLERIVITIEDDGKGIKSDNDKNALFKRGSRLDESVDGTGIGLTITKEIIELYGGSIKLSDSKLGGLKVEIIFNKS